MTTEVKEPQVAMFDAKAFEIHALKTKVIVSKDLLAEIKDQLELDAELPMKVWAQVVKYEIETDGEDRSLTQVIEIKRAQYTVSDFEAARVSSK